MSTPTASYPRATQPPAIGAVAELLDLLYLRPLPNLLTLSLYDRRYAQPEHRRAVAFILEQTRRQIMAGRDYPQLGLCYFHTGLIHRRWGRALDAAHFFNDARLYWNLAGELPYVCLAQFAQAAAQHEGLLLETALLSYEKAQQYLPRLKQLLNYRNQQREAVQIKAFCSQMSTLLADIYQQLRRELWQLSMPMPMSTPPPGASGMASSSSFSTSGPTAVAHQTEPPQVHADLQPTTTRPVPTASGMDTVPEPQPMLTPDSANNRRWFQLINHNANFLPTLHAGDMVLVQLASRHHFRHDDLLITASKIPEAIGVRPQISANVSDAYCLGKFVGPAQVGAWVLFHHDRSPTAVPPEAIVGHVVTTWRTIHS
jgi:hypothetical protein